MTEALRPWKAEETTDLNGDNRKITVTGEVSTAYANEKPVLTEVPPPTGIDPTTLILELTIDSKGVGPALVGVAPAKFTKPVSFEQYKHVIIRRDGSENINIEVQLILSKATS
jgi:hypothetical protein